MTPARVRAWHAWLGDAHPTRNAHAYALLHAICATACKTKYSTPTRAASARPCKPNGAATSTF
jgi:hypothetical protein